MKRSFLLLNLILSSSPGKCHNDISQTNKGKKNPQNGKSLDTDYEKTCNLQCIGYRPTNLLHRIRF